MDAHADPGHVDDDGDVRHLPVDGEDHYFGLEAGLIWKGVDTF